MKLPTLWKRVMVVAPLVVLCGWGTQSDAQPTVIQVGPGDSLSEAVSRAPAGSTIIVAAGEYRESLTVRQPGLRLIGAGPSQGGTVLSNEEVNANNGITVMIGADNFELSGFLIKGFNKYGVWLIGVHDYRIAHNRFEDNGEYGVFPLFCSGGTLSDNVASGHTDSGLYVGQSSGATLAHNVVRGNFKGIEVENSLDCTVMENEAVANTVGILVIALDLTSVRNTERVVVKRNYVHGNPPTPDGATGAISPGGILVIGADQVTVSDNIVLRNRPFGVAVMRLPESLDRFDPDVEHLADDNQIVGNIALNNAMASDDGVVGANLFWDGTGSNNCWKDNLFVDEMGGSSVPPPESLPVCSEETGARP